MGIPAHKSGSFDWKKLTRKRRLHTRPFAFIFKRGFKSIMRNIIKNVLTIIMLFSIAVFVINIVKYRLIDTNDLITNYGDLVTQTASLPFLIALISGILLFVF